MLFNAFVKSPTKNDLPSALRKKANSYPLPSGINIHIGRRIQQTQQWTGLADISRGLAEEISLEVLLTRGLRNGARRIRNWFSAELADWAPLTRLSH
jgi:hypothetical protein